MKIRLMILVTALFLAGCNLNDSVQFSGDLAEGEEVSGVLELETPDTFYFDFMRDTYISGVCNQLSVDVVITLYDSAGVSFGKVDGRGVGLEKFNFEVNKAGPYFLEVAPADKGTGAYSLELRTVEPVALGPEKRADQLFAPYSGNDVPGGVIGVIREGNVIFSKAYGMANLTYRIPWDLNTPTNIGSISKQFTAFAILLLEQQGKLSLEDDVRAYIPELPDLGALVRIKNLLNHTNGFREVYNLLPMTGWKGSDVLTREEVLELLQRQEKLQNLPGETFNYNNSAFIMLAEIIERISGQAFPDFMDENIFGPLGMSSTFVRGNPSVIIPEASQGYNEDSLGYHIVGDLHGAVGAGGMYTTPSDFARWMGNFSNPIIGGKDLIARLVSVDTLNNGDTMTYAQGIAISEIRGLKCYSHGGGDLAHTSFGLYFPEIDAGVVAFGSSSNFKATVIASEMAELYFKNEMEHEEDSSPDGEGKNVVEEEVNLSEVIVPDALLQAYAGKYFITGMGFEMEFRLTDGQLMRTPETGPDQVLIPDSHSKFNFKDRPATIEFFVDEEEEITSAELISGGTRYMLEPVLPYKPTIKEFQTLSGLYFSKELESFCSLELRDSSMVLLIPRTEGVEIEALKKNVFKGSEETIAELLFMQNEVGEVTGFVASNGRTKGVVFERK